MTVWFVIPIDREVAFRGAYLAEQVRGVDAPDEDEGVGVMVVNHDGTKLMTGTSRMTEAGRQALSGRKPPWLEIYTSYDDLIASGWKYGDLRP